MSSFDHHTDWVNDIVLCKNSSIRELGESKVGIHGDYGSCWVWVGKGREGLGRRRENQFSSFSVSVLSASSDTTLKVWNVPKATCLSTLKNHKDYVRCLAYSSARDIAASAGLDKIISIWDVNMLTELSSLNNTVTS